MRNYLIYLSYMERVEKATYFFAFALTINDLSIKTEQTKKCEAIEKSIGFTLWFGE